MYGQCFDKSTLRIWHKNPYDDSGLTPLTVASERSWINILGPSWAHATLESTQVVLSGKNQDKFRLKSFRLMYGPINLVNTMIAEYLLSEAQPSDLLASSPLDDLDYSAIHCYHPCFAPCRDQTHSVDLVWRFGPVPKESQCHKKKTALDNVSFRPAIIFECKQHHCGTFMDTFENWRHFSIHHIEAYIRLAMRILA